MFRESEKLFRDYISNLKLQEAVLPPEEIEWNNADLNTPFIKSIIQDYAAEKNISIIDAEKEVQDKIEEATTFLEETPKMSVTALKGVTEQVIFDFIPDVSGEEFTLKNLKKMFTYIEGTYARYFPLRDGDTGKIMTPSIHITPSLIPQPDWMTSVKTAAASAEADIIFYKPFAQKLIYYARKKGVQGTASFYESQGGDIPDSYVYIEFLIRHELGHVTRGDATRNTRMLAKYICKNKEKYPKLLTKFGWDGK